MPRHGGARAGKHKQVPDTQPASYYRIVLVGIAAAGIVLQAAALGPLRDSFWGLHLFAFVPRWAAVVGWIGVTAAAVVLLFSPGWKNAGNVPLGRLDRIPAWGVVAGAVVLAVLFWVFRSNQTILGDGLPMTIDLPKGVSFHPRQPLAVLLQGYIFKGLSGFLYTEGMLSTQLAHRTVAVGSVAAGFVFVLAAFGIGRALSPEWRGSGKSDGSTGDRRDSIALLVTLVLLSQGYAELLFGYVENYTFYVLTIALYLWASLLYIRRRLPLSVAALALVLGVGIHLSTVMLVPSFLYLLGWGMLRGGRRADAAAGLATAAAAVLVLNWVLGQWSPGFTLWGGIVQILDVANTSQGGAVGISYMFSWNHIRDFFNEQYLIGPLAAFLFVPGLFYAARLRQYRSPMAVFFALAAGAYLAGSWATSDPLLGYARDWDLFAPAAVCYAAAGTYFVVSHVSTIGHRRRLLVFALVVSFVHVTPWICINHSQARSLERFKTLPLGYGRTEVAVGNWYMRNERPVEAEEWFERALQVNPFNVNAYFLLGVLYKNTGRVDPARDMFETAIKLKPNKPEFRERYVELLLDAERCDNAVPHLNWLSKRKPADFRYWQVVGREMLDKGCGDALEEIYQPVLTAVELRMQTHPDDVDAHVLAGIFLGNLKRFDEALEMFDRALGIYPDSPAGLFNAGMLLLYTDRREEGRPYLEKFIGMYPDHPMNEFAKQHLATNPQKENE